MLREFHIGKIILVKERTAFRILYLVNVATLYSTYLSMFMTLYLNMGGNCIQFVVFMLVLL